VDLLHFFLSGICHQLPEHSLHFQGRPLPLCARCMGTFLGAILALLLLWVLGRGRRSELPARGPLLVLALLALAWATDGLNSLAVQLLGAGLYPSTNVLRLITGVGFGLALGVFLYPVAQFALWRNAELRPVVERVSELWPLLAGGAALVALATLWRSAPYALWAALIVGATAGLMGLVNGLLIALILHARGFATRAVQLAPYMAGGLALSLLETGSVALLRLWLGVAAP
jgi:uncharacterized membrane protein